jgi:hypothetical protein
VFHIDHVLRHRAVAAAAALVALFSTSSAQAQDAWTGGTSISWTDSTNWNSGAGPVPGSSNTDVALFNGLGNSNTSITLGNTALTPGGITFDTANAAAYTLGSNTSDGSFTIAAAGNATAGAIALTATVTTAQTINSPITLTGTSQFITNYGTASSSLTLNGTLTLPASTTTTVDTGTPGVSGSASSASTTKLGNILLPGTGPANSSLLNIATNGNSSIASNPSLIAGTTIGNGIISGGPAGNGSTGGTPATTTTAVTISGTGNTTGESNGSNPGIASSISAGTYQPNPLNTYSGGTNANGVSASICLITGSSDGAVDGSGNVSGITHGPFGTGTVFFTGANLRIRPVGGSYVIYNPITEVNSGFGIDSNVANDTNSITYAGPILSNTGAGRFISNGYSHSENTTVATGGAPVYGATMILGLAATPSTITLPTTTAATTNIVAINGPVIVNDLIVDGAGRTTTQTVAFNAQNQDYYSIRINGASTYVGPTTLGGANFPNMGAFLIGVSSTGAPGSVTFGPFGQGTVTMNNSTQPPVLVPIGADRTIANAITLTSGFFASTNWNDAINLAAGTNGTTTIARTNPSAQNLFLTGVITNTGKTITNNMVAGVGLYLGSPTVSSANPWTGTTVFQTQLTSGGTGVGTTYIYDTISSTGGITVQNGATLKIFSANTYTGTNSVTSGGTLMAMNTTGSATGSNTVTVSGASSGTTFPGVLAGTGIMSGAVTISAGTGGGANGAIAPGSVTASQGLNNAPIIPVSLGTLGLAGGLTLSGTYFADVQTSPNASDLISITGNLTLGAASILNLPGTNTYDNPSNGTVYELASYTGSLLGNPTFGTEVGVPTGYQVYYGTYPSRPNEIDLAPAAVPEPGTLAMLAVAAGGIVVRRGRRTKSS